MLKTMTPPEKVRLQLKINPKQKIEAIKDFRSVTGSGLIAAKVMVEALIAANVEFLTLEFNANQVPEDARIEVDYV